jgi:hypothetical protein
MGLSPQLQDHVIRGVWYGGAIGLVFVLLLIATAGLWVGGPSTASSSGRKPGKDRPEIPDKRSRNTIIILALTATFAAGCTAFPRLSQSLWGDEDYSLRFHLLGQFARAQDHPRLEDGRPYFLKLSWMNTAFGYATTNNHFLYSITTRALHQAWQRAGNLRSYEFDERILRAAPYAAGLLSIGAWVILAMRLGLPCSTLPFLLLIWCHPWFIRYITEARGYAFVFLLLPVCLITLLRALDHGRWKAWIAFGLCQFLMLYSWPGIALHVAWLNLLTGTTLLFRCRHTPVPAGFPSSAVRPSLLVLARRLEQPMRWAVANLLTILLLLPLVAPAYPQVHHYLTETQLQIPITGTWLADLPGFFALGIPAVDFYEGLTSSNPYYLSIESLARNHGSGIYLYLGAFHLLLLIGLAQFCLRARHGPLLATALIGAAVMLWLVGHSKERYLFHWYFVYLQPFVLLLVATGLAAIWRGLKRRIPRTKNHPRGARREAVAATAALILVGLCSFCFAAPCLRVLRKHSLDPLRESVLYVRGSTDPRDPGMRDYLLGHVHFGAYCYDAHAFPVSEAFSNDPVYPGITGLMRASDARQVPLFFNVGFPANARLVLPQIMNLLDDDKLFEPIRIFWSLEPQFVRQVFRYRGGFFPPGLRPDYRVPPWADAYGSPLPPAMIPDEAERSAVNRNANTRALSPRGMR